MKKPSLLLLPLLALAVFGPGSAWAQQGGHGGRGGQPGRGGPEAPRAGHDRGEDHRALSDAVRRVERQTRGQVLSAERVPYDGRDVSRVKVVDSSGRVRIYMDDPQARGDGPRTRRDDNDND
jgi:hypothetical protein